MVKRSLTAFSLVLLVLGSIAVAAADVSRLAPALRQWMDLSSGEAAARGEAAGEFAELDGLQVGISPTGATWVRVLVRTADPVGATTFLGVPVGFSRGQIASLSATPTDLARLASDERVLYIEPSVRVRASLDASVPAVGGDTVHDAFPSVTGDGVIVGLVDTGIDYEHLDFRFDSDGDGFEESSRIVAIWDQTYGLLGAEYDQGDIESDLAFGYGPSEGSVREKDVDGHGTHVASIAAGDGSSSEYGFVGMAPEASIVAVKTSFYTSDILEGVAYVFDVADDLGMPAVVNLSLGGHEGPHDGTSLFEQGLDALAEDAGRVIVVSAGNEGDEAIHTSATLRSGAKAFEIMLEDWELELDLWYPGDARFTITVTSPSGESATAASGRATGYVLTSDGIVYLDNASGGSNPNNGDREAYLWLTNATSGDVWTITVERISGSGGFDAWITTSSGTIVDGDSSSTVDEPGNAAGVITVGSFNTKSTWPSEAGTQDFTSTYPVAILSSFSSQGPTRDGRTKPDIAAPGAWICAARSSKATSLAFLMHPDGVHVMELGTSMAAPHVAGACALLLSIDPTLFADEVRSLLTSTATKDGTTGTTPNVRWGWGKLDVAAAVESLGTTEPVIDDVERPEVELEANPVSSVATFVYGLPEGTSTAVLRVYTASGVRVHETELSVTDDAYVWDLYSLYDERLAAGLYLYVLVTDLGVSEVGRLVILPS